MQSRPNMGAFYIYEMVSSAITSESLSPDKRLPSCRDLLANYNVSRNTVFTAYNRLIDIGLIVSRNRSGYFVNPIAHSLLAPNTEAELALQATAPSPVEFEFPDLVPVFNPP